MQSRGDANLLSREEAAQHVGFTLDEFEKWSELGIFLAAHPITGGWSKQALAQALDAVRRDGWSAHRDLPNIQRQPRTNDLGLTKYHHYRRGIPGALEGKPGSGAYMASLIEKNRQFALKHRDNPPTKDAPKVVTATPLHSPSHSPAPSVQQQTPPSIPSHAVLHMGRLAPSDHTPLFPTEQELAIAILGVARASEWPALAARLEREGLPVADPVMGTRFLPAIIRFFEARYGLDGGLASNKRVPAPKQETKIPFCNPELVTQNSSGPLADEDLMTEEEVLARFRGTLSDGTLKNWRSMQIGPPFTRVGRKIFYSRALLLEWEKDHTLMCDLARTKKPAGGRAS